jgi:hypothetical protein
VINLKLFKSPQWPRLLLDLIMLILAVVHFGLLVFDSTYFRFRNFYSFYAPSVVLFYDPVKGVTPHQFTGGYLSQASEYFSSCHAAQSVDPKLQAQLVVLSEQMIEENPFERAGVDRTIGNDQRKYAQVYWPQNQFQNGLSQFLARGLRPAGDPRKVLSQAYCSLYSDQFLATNRHRWPAC